ncbi:helix-turn-helix domain-containing protein [Saccharopolyspora elongata]|uniref:Helix-turn-helix domain-containing protein n=1 Tax=Saccharopolyspora elongata TaxID=2530387 RepID=A0A4R4XV13_9PSEU|nr:helix-turn-helix domain-containing protein [Saccharopolyspora elongata]
MVGDDERWSCVSVYVAPEVVTRKLGYEAEFHEPVVTAPALRAELLRLALSPVDATTPHLVQRLLDAVFTQAPLGPGRFSPEVAQAHSWLSGDAGRESLEPLSIGQVAAQLGWSRETFTRRFTQATGTPPYAWHLQERLRRARRLLRQGLSVGAAMSLTNPMNVVYWGGAAAAVSGALGEEPSWQSMAVFFIGFFAASLLWCWICAGAIALFRRALPARGVRAIEAVCGLSLVGLGIWLAASI